LGDYSNNDGHQALTNLAISLENTHAMNVAEHHQPLDAYLEAAIPSAADAPLRSGPELSIVVPTFNERENIAELIGGHLRR
jgi:hypothetical protein